MSMTDVLAGPTTIEEKDIAGEMLECAKTSAKTLTVAALEAATPELRRIFIEELNSTLEEQDKIFRYMNSKGWYDPFKQPRQMAESDLEEARRAVPRHQ